MGFDRWVVMLSKRDALYAMLEDGPVLVAVDASQPGVVVPASLMGAPNLVLRYGYSLVPTIPDLFLTTEALMGTLSFQGTPYHCTLPWGAIFSMSVEGCNHAAVWPREEGVEIEIEVEDPPPPKPRHLKLVD